MKKALSILLCIVMVLAMVPMALADGATPLTIDADKKTDLKPGDTISFTVKLGAVTDLDSISFDLVIPEGLTFVEGSGKCAAPADLGMAALSFNPTVKRVGGYGAFNGTNGFTSAADVTVLEFKCTVDANTHGDKDVSLTKVTVADVDGTSLLSAATGVTVSVPKTSYTPKSLSLSYTDTLAIENKNFDGTAAATLSGTDTDDDPLPAAELAKVEFSVDKAWAAVSKDGVVSIKDIAAAEAGDITVTAKLGSVTTTATVAVTKAAPVVTEVVGAANNPTTALIPTDADSKDYTYAVDVLDQYGAKMTGETVTWAATGTTEKITFNATTATLTVAKDAVAGKVTLTATVGEGAAAKTATIKVNVTNISFDGVENGVKASDGVYGDKLSDMVKIDASKLTATAGGAVAGTYTLVDADTVPDAAANVAYQVVFNSTDGKYKDIPVTEGTVKVEPKTITVTAKDVSVRVRTEVEEVEKLYGYTNTALVGDDALTGTATYTLKALNEDGTVGTQTVALTEEVMEQANEYAIVVAGLNVPNETNYTIAFSDAGRMEIRKKMSNTAPVGTGTNPDGTEKDPENPTPDKLVFDDVTKDDWFNDAVNYVAEKGLMTGIAEKTFAPHDTTTRAMIATILWRQAGSPKPLARIADFPDVVDGSWYADAVRWCAEKEIVTGFEDGTFGPDKEITREQLAAMLYRYAGSPEVDAVMGMAGFEDVDTISEWAATAMRWAVQNGILNGKDGVRLDPQGQATRAETAAMFQRYLSKK